MDEQQLEKIRAGRGFIAALDQSGGSTPHALAAYGIAGDAYSTDEEMFDLMQAMRSRIALSPAFDGDHILGAILFEDSLHRGGWRPAIRRLPLDSEAHCPLPEGRPGPGSGQ